MMYSLWEVLYISELDVNYLTFFLPWNNNFIQHICVYIHVGTDIWICFGGDCPVNRKLFCTSDINCYGCHPASSWCLHAFHPSVLLRWAITCCSHNQIYTELNFLLVSCDFCWNQNAITVCLTSLICERMILIL